MPLASTALAVVVVVVPAAATAATELPGKGFLPDNRAWEMVSPLDKNGADIISSGTSTQPMDDCDTDCGVAFTAQAGFGDQPGLSGVYGNYISERTGVSGTQGWSTHGINPAQEASSILVAGNTVRTGYGIAEMAPDLSAGVFSALSPVATADDPHPNVVNAFNFYRRTDALQPGSGNYQLLTDAPTLLPFNIATGNLPRYGAGNMGTATVPALSTVAFESSRRLADATPPDARRLYINASGMTHVVTAAPQPGDARCGGAGLACTTVASTAIVGSRMPSAITRGGAQIQNAVSTDGTKVFYYGPVGVGSGGTSADGTASDPGSVIAASRLYMRDDRGTADTSDDTFTRIQQSEKTTPESTSRATFQKATTDGRQVFFTTTEGLVNGDDNGGVDLYRYTDSADPATDSNLTRISVDSEGTDDPDVTGVVAASDNGEYVYFLADGQLVSGQPALPDGNGLYMWHDGQVSYLGNFAEPADTVPNAIGAATFFFNNASSAYSAQVTDEGVLLFQATDSDGFIGLGDYEGYNHGTCRYWNQDLRPVTPDQLQNPDGCREYFVFEPASDGTPTAPGSLQCATCRPSGAPAGGGAITFSDRAAFSGPTSYPRQPIVNALSDDGRYVFFNSNDRLVAEDENGPCTAAEVGAGANPGDSGPTNNSGGFGKCTDGYVYDTETGQVHLLTSGSVQSMSPSFFVDASADGHDAFIATRDQLSAWDIDGAYDLYDARIDGGFPEPMLDQSCTGVDECRGDSTGAPAVPNMGSVGFGGDGNVPLVPDPVNVSVGVSKLKAVIGVAARLRVRVPDAGRISVAGSSVRRTNKSTSKAGTYSVRITLTSKAKKSLKKRKKLKVNVRVSYRAKGGRSVSKTIKVTFKQPKTRKGGR